MAPEVAGERVARCRLRRGALALEPLPGVLGERDPSCGRVHVVARSLRRLTLVRNCSASTFRTNVFERLAPSGVRQHAEFDMPDPGLSGILLALDPLALQHVAEHVERRSPVAVAGSESLKQVEALLEVERRMYVDHHSELHDGKGHVG